MDLYSPPMSESSEWLGTKEASGKLGVTLRTLYRFIDSGQLPAYQFGRVIRIKISDLDAFVESIRIKPGTLKHLYPDTSSDTSATESKRK